MFIFKLFCRLLILGLIFTAFGCKDIFSGPHDELSMQREDYTGNQLRIDGYYYQQDVDNKYGVIIFFYANGVLMNLGGGFEVANEAEYEKKLSSSDYIDEYFKNDKTTWGVFNIRNNIIKYERWYHGSGGARPAYIREGEILSDSSFIIKKYYRMRKGNKTEISSIEEKYYFKNFSPKPDSTNNFIK